MAACVLGAKEGANFVINENANDILKEVVEQVENDKIGTFRMSLVNDRVLYNQIIPCLIASKESNTISINVVRLLSKMTAPYSVVFAYTNITNRPPNETYHSYLSSIKERFNDPLVTWAFLKLFKSIANTNPSLTDKNGAILKDCLSLLTNLFSIAEFQPSSTAAAVIAHLQRPSKQNGLIWNLLCQSFDSILLDLIHKRLWSEPVVEIIRLMFQNTKAEVMQKLIKEWMDSASNTSSDYTYPWSSDENEEFSSPNSNSDPEVISKKSKRKSEVIYSTDSGLNAPPNTDLLESLIREPGAESELDLDHTNMDCEIPSTSLQSVQPGYLSPPNASKANLNTSKANHSSSTMSDDANVESRDIMEGNKRKVQDILANLTSGISASTMEPSPKKRKLSGEREVGQKKRLLSRAERRKYQKDGFSSGITGSENGSSDSESEEEQWRVKAGDFSDPGYYSYQNQLATAKRTLEKNTQKESRDRRKRLIEIRSKTKKLKVYYRLRNAKE